MARRPHFAAWWWLPPAAAFGAALVSDACFVATQDPAWWRLSEWALGVGLVSGLVGLGRERLCSEPPDRSAELKLATASVVLRIAALCNYAFSLGLRVIAAPASAFAWLGLYLAAAASVLFLAAGYTAWRSRKLHAAHALRVTMAPDREKARR